MKACREGEKEGELEAGGTGEAQTGAHVDELGASFVSRLAEEMVGEDVLYDGNRLVRWTRLGRGHLMGEIRSKGGRRRRRSWRSKSSKLTTLSSLLNLLFLICFSVSRKDSFAPPDEQNRELFFFFFFLQC